VVFVCSWYLIAPSQMHSHNQIPIRILHVLQRNIPQNPRVINQHIYPSKVLNSRSYDFFPALDAVVVRYCDAACFCDFCDDLVCGLRR
jgi:hypothetical protein